MPKYIKTSQRPPYRPNARLARRLVGLARDLEAVAARYRTAGRDTYARNLIYAARIVGAVGREEGGEQ